MRPASTRLAHTWLLATFTLTACPPDSNITDPTGAAETGAPGTTSGGATSAPTTGGTTSGTTGETTADVSTSTTDAPGTGSTGGSEPGSTGGTGDTGLIPTPDACDDLPVPPCDDPLTTCKQDPDADQRPFTCDNAPWHTNPDQQDLDGDGFGDIIDLCPTIAGDNNIADSDRDGVGNDCDTCPKLDAKYDGIPVPFYMRARNIPQQHDSDGDGVGDACDNCVRTPNCLNYGIGPGLTPFVVGMPIDRTAPGCQSDQVAYDSIGDLCVGTTSAGAAGKVGFGDADDFDQDGLVNLEDGCPRQPVPPRACDVDADCPTGALCAATGVCNHTDHDGDGVGDICDTCPDVANPEQITEEGSKLDDPDRDFIGAACEQNQECEDRPNPRRFAFYDVSVGGLCCTTLHGDAPIFDPDGNPIPVDALGPLPPGTLELPPGCEEALAATEDGKAHAIEWCNVDAPGELWNFFCLLPTWDQDLDRVPDTCDRCPQAYDPLNQIYVDGMGKEWPAYGKYCSGTYDEAQLDPALMCAQGT